MADREKLMRALTLCANGEPCMGEKYRTCPYSPIGKHEHYNCGAEMAADAIAMLREQEAVELLKEQEPNEPVTMKPFYFNYICSGCGSEIDGEFIDYTGGKIKFCPYCGKKVDWNA